MEYSSGAVTDALARRTARSTAATVSAALASMRASSSARWERADANPAFGSRAAASALRLARMRGLSIPGLRGDAIGARSNAARGAEEAISEATTREGEAI